jgi:hypothetical protein
VPGKLPLWMVLIVFGDEGLADDVIADRHRSSETRFEQAHILARLPNSILIFWCLFWLSSFGGSSVLPHILGGASYYWGRAKPLALVLNCLRNTYLCTS